ncbi:hypothetical protein ELE36_01665 [Pseudolysobacter antarcticus]|uniref:Uncharacterized protein n=2 Tax=Pseudolysobacter antarcticus TaxID=2511995 RepID=A0A411HFC3_9GAMM|nr:hypothetical protein ELE36_01665 [Pseudolysobacter antarcticus]
MKISVYANHGLSIAHRWHRRGLFSGTLLIALLTSAGMCCAATGAALETVTAKIDGHAWVASRVLATAPQFGAKPVLSVTAFVDAKPASHFTFNIFVPAADRPIGHFAFGAGAPTVSTHGGFFANAGLDADPMQDNYSFSDGAIIIDASDAAAHSVSGTFFGTAKNHSGKQLIISEGHFTNVTIEAAAKP